MRKIRIIAVGKDKDTWVEEGVAHYLKLLGRYATVDIGIVPKSRLPQSAPQETIMQDEAQSISSKVGENNYFALHDRGELFTSEKFAKFMEKATAGQRGALTFVIGGAYGLDRQIISRAQACLSLSPLTFSHQIVRLVLLEQLYRAFTIIDGTDYHK